MNVQRPILLPALDVQLCSEIRHGRSIKSYHKVGKELGMAQLRAQLRMSSAHCLEAYQAMIAETLRSAPSDYGITYWHNWKFQLFQYVIPHICIG